MTGIAVTVFSCRQKTESLSIAQLVKTAEVKTREGLLTVTYPGRLQAASDVKLSFRDGRTDTENFCFRRRIC